MRLDVVIGEFFLVCSPPCSSSEIQDSRVMHGGGPLGRAGMQRALRTADYSVAISSFVVHRHAAFLINGMLFEETFKECGFL